MKPAVPDRERQASFASFVSFGKGPSKPIRGRRSVSIAAQAFKPPVTN
jgi:hypothetical protein